MRLLNNAIYILPGTYHVFFFAANDYSDDDDEESASHDFEFEENNSDTDNFVVFDRFDTTGTLNTDKAEPEFEYEQHRRQDYEDGSDCDGEEVEECEVVFTKPQPHGTTGNSGNNSSSSKFATNNTQEDDEYNFEPMPNTHNKTSTTNFSSNSNNKKSSSDSDIGIVSPKFNINDYIVTAKDFEEEAAFSQDEEEGGNDLTEPSIYYDEGKCVFCVRCVICLRCDIRYLWVFLLYLCELDLRSTNRVLSWYDLILASFVIATSLSSVIVSNKTSVYNSEQDEEEAEEQRAMNIAIKEEKQKQQLEQETLDRIEEKKAALEALQNSHGELYILLYILFMCVCIYSFAVQLEC